jgi:hypothetical protein
VYMVVPGRDARGVWTRGLGHGALQQSYSYSGALLAHGQDKPLRDQGGWAGGCLLEAASQRL